MKPFAKVADVKVGSVLIPDAGFPCCSEGQEKVVYKDGLDGSLYILCQEGQHDLTFQIKNDYYNGFYLKA